MGQTISETDLVRACINYLHMKGIAAWRQNTGATKTVYKGKVSFTRFGVPGACDITGIMPDGRRLEIECKVGKNKPTKKQLQYMKTIQDNGGVVGVVWDLDDLALIIDKNI